MTSGPGRGSPWGSGLSIGLAAEGDIDPTAWSGTPAGLADGLRAHGVTVVPLRAAVPRQAERVLRRLPGWRLTAASRREALDWRIRRASRLDAVVLIGSLAPVRGTLPIVTFEDMTVRQARTLGEPFVVERPVAEVEAWIDRQRRLYERAVATCALGHWAAESIVADYGVAASRVHVVGAGVNHVVPALTRSWTQPRFLFVGRDFERKNGPSVLRAFAALRAARPEARLDVVGGHPPLDAPGVHGHGLIELDDPAGRTRLDALFAAATCLVMPSRYEPFGIAYAEAGTAGVPSISTSVGAEFVDETCGRRVAPGDDAALLDAMRELADGELARALGEAARVRSALFTWPLVAGRVLRSLAESLGRPADGLPAYL